QPLLFRGLLAPLDLVLVVLCLWTIRTWGEVVPTWRRTAATAGLLSVAFLNREVFFLFVPVFVGCSVSAYGRRHLAKVGATLLFALLLPATWDAVVSSFQGVNLLTEVIGYVRYNSTLVPFVAFLPWVLAGGVPAALLALTAVYAIAALVRLARGEWLRLRERRPLSAEGLWGMCVLLTFLRAGPKLLDTVGSYGRILLL